MYLELWWFLTVPIFFAIGWVTSRWDRKKNRGRKVTKLNDLEKLVLNLTEEKHAEAIALLQRVIKDYDKSFYLQKSLGILFRRRGLFDRAIDTHAALLSIKKIDVDLRDSLLIDLTKDYVGAGIYDKAYQALEIVKSNKYRHDCLNLRLKINQRLKQWDSALKTLTEIENHEEEKYENIRAHFLCELAENGGKDYKRKLVEMKIQHPRVSQLLSEKDELLSDTDEFICNRCATKFDYFFWKCNLCETWDSCERLG